MAIHAQALGLMLVGETIDPNAFHLDWERTFEALAAVVVLSIILERALSLVFETQWWLIRPRLRDAREMVAFVVCTAVCWFLQFDALSIIILQDRAHVVGYVITGAVIAGGSKGSIKLFRELLDFKSGAYKDYEEAKNAKKQEEGEKDGEAKFFGSDRASAGGEAEGALGGTT